MQKCPHGLNGGWYEHAPIVPLYYFLASESRSYLIMPNPDEQTNTFEPRLSFHASRILLYRDIFLGPMNGPILDQPLISESLPHTKFRASGHFMQNIKLWRQVQDTYKCGHVYSVPDKLIPCEDRYCKFSPLHPDDCGSNCGKTCWQYRQFPEQYNLKLDRLCLRCEREGPGWDSTN
ncbi:hypothetical protein BD779DRAFT_850841 [Infundibulicybe gibba]|nr:hypothetical protein BD779DRAFT_850841 [Infundibulicybe gibba]